MMEMNTTDFNYKNLHIPKKKKFTYTHIINLNILKNIRYELIKADT